MTQSKDTLFIESSELPRRYICSGAPVTLDAGSALAYNWSSGSSARAITVTLPGVYKATVTYRDTLYSDSVLVLSAINPEFDLGFDTTFCTGMTLRKCVPYQNVMWNDGSTGTCKFITTSGIYWAKAIDVTGCQYSDTIQITVKPLSFTILGKDKYCEGDTIALRSSISADSYRWNFSATDTNITYKEPVSKTLFRDKDVRTIALSVTNKNKCTGIASKNITVYKKPVLFGGIDTIIVRGKEYTLAPPYLFEAEKLFWSTGDTTLSIKTNTDCTYWLYAKQFDGCATFDTITVLFDRSNIVVSTDSVIVQAPLPAKNPPALVAIPLDNTDKPVENNTSEQTIPGIGCPFSEDDRYTVNISPNPSSGLFKVSLIDKGAVYQCPPPIQGSNMAVYSPYGSTVNKNFGYVPWGKSFTIDLTGSPQGIYLLQMYFNNKLHTYKLVLIRN